jgi:hypothetical protein
MSAGRRRAQQHAKGGDAQGRRVTSLQAGLASTGSDALAKLAPGIEAGVKELQAQQDAAGKSYEKLTPAVESTFAKSDALKAAIAAGASPENIAAACAGARRVDRREHQGRAEADRGLLPAIPSITLWAMKDINAAALWSMTLETRVKNIDINAKNKDVNVKAKRSVNVEAETKDLNVKARRPTSRSRARRRSASPPKRTTS